LYDISDSFSVDTEVSRKAGQVHSSYVYNSLGELQSSQDNTATTVFNYDLLSRLTDRSAGGENTHWQWGNNAAVHNIGELQYSERGGYKENFEFDSFGRLHNRLIQMSGNNYSIGYQFNGSSGLLEWISFPTTDDCGRLSVRYNYQYGLLQSVQDYTGANYGTVYWQANETSTSGSVSKETLGNGIIVERDLDAVTGQLNWQHAGVGGGTGIQNASFSYDQIGNVTLRQDGNRGLNENFCYDSLYRLSFVTASTTDCNGTHTLDLSYFDNGNIKSKSDVSGATQWTYDANKKHAVKTAGTLSFDYDPSGNVTQRGTASIAWNAENQPIEINSAASGEWLRFNYDPDGQRWRQVYANANGTETTYFIGDALEKTQRQDGGVDYRHYVYANGRAVAIVTRHGNTQDVHYLIDDHQGSTAVITNASGQVELDESFDSFGNARNADTWSGAPTPAKEALLASLTRRGYTFHTNLGSSALGLVHMNGRVQDAVTGRFLSADPYITEPGNTQNFNRYSYVYNNPLSNTDPSGFSTASGIAAVSAWVRCRWYGSESYDCNSSSGPNGELPYLTVNGVKDQASGSRFAGQSGNTPWYTNRFAGFFSSGAHWTWEKFTAPLTAPYQRCFAFDAMQECEPYGEPEPLTLLEVAGEIPVGKALGAAGAGLKAAGIISLVAKSAARGLMNAERLVMTHGRTLSRRELNLLKSDIAKNGIKDPIKYVEVNGKNYIVDGHHRLLAARELGIGNVPVQQVQLPFGGYRTVADLFDRGW
jgi:RHS repeat-associated protein